MTTHASHAPSGAADACTARNGSVSPTSITCCETYATKNDAGSHHAPICARYCARCCARIRHRKSPIRGKPQIARCTVLLIALVVRLSDARTPGARQEARSQLARHVERLPEPDDAARPLVDEALIGRVFEAAACFDAVVPGLPVRDTLKRGDHQVVEGAERDATVDSILGIGADEETPEIGHQISANYHVVVEFPFGHVKFMMHRTTGTECW